MYTPSVADTSNEVPEIVTVPDPVETNRIAWLSPNDMTGDGLPITRMKIWV